MKRFAATLYVLCVLTSLAGCRLDKDGNSLNQSLDGSRVGVGGSVTVTDRTDGNAFLAGGDVATAGEISGSLFAAGGDVSVGGNVGDDLYAAGGNVRVDAIVSGNARVAGGDVTLGPATVVTGSTALAGGQVRFEGDARGELQVEGGSVSIDGTVRGDANIDADDVDIGPQANIGGKLVVHSASEPVVPPGAHIAGGLEFHRAQPHHDEPAREVHAFPHGVGSLFWLVGVFAVAALFTFAFPAYSTRAADWIGREPLRSLGLGFVVLFCLPILCVLLLVTIIGIPLALIVGALYLLLLFLGWITAALFLARQGLRWLRPGQSATTALQLGALAVSILALWLIGHVPLVGGWIKFAALLFGIGALVWQGWPRRRAVNTVPA